LNLLRAQEGITLTQTHLLVKGNMNRMDLFYENYKAGKIWT